MFASHDALFYKQNTGLRRAGEFSPVSGLLIQLSPNKMGPL